ncbi:MAG: hypothetical protein WB996_03030 [Ignavibacteriaceae bacterium]
MHGLIKNKYLLNFLLIVFCNLIFAGCYSVKEITDNDYESIEVLKVEKSDGQIIDFTVDPKGYAIISDSSIIRTDRYNLKEKINLSEINKIYADKFDPDKTFYLVIGSVLGLGLVLALIFAPKQPFGG